MQTGCGKRDRLPFTAPTFNGPTFNAPASIALNRHSVLWSQAGFMYILNIGTTQYFISRLLLPGPVQFCDFRSMLWTSLCVCLSHQGSKNWTKLDPWTLLARFLNWASNLIPSFGPFHHTVHCSIGMTHGPIHQTVYCSIDMTTGPIYDRWSIAVLISPMSPSYLHDLTPTIWAHSSTIVYYEPWAHISWTIENTLKPPLVGPFVMV